MHAKTQIWELMGWPRLRYEAAALHDVCAETEYALGVVAGRMAELPSGTYALLKRQSEAEEIVRTAWLSGHAIERQAAMSAVSDMEASGDMLADERAIGLAQVLRECSGSGLLSLTRLRAWHACLFPSGFDGGKQIRPGRWRSAGSSEPAAGTPCPPPERLVGELEAFLKWLELDQSDHYLIKAALAHIWFMALSPFQCGNARLARMISRRVLAGRRAAIISLCSLSAQLSRDRAGYVEAMEIARTGDLDLTSWVSWFCNQVQRAAMHAEVSVARETSASRFWQRCAALSLNPRQLRALDHLQRNPDDALHSKRWSEVVGVSSDTALRDLNELTAHGLLVRQGRARAARFVLAEAP
jgi:Fic family protein